ncbi:MAG: DinB family protein [Chitinophagaceae bacterium]
MLKRTISRLLLSLIVITGLAGTLKDNSISSKERKFAVGLMKESKEAVIKSTQGLSKAQLNFKASPEKWSISECIYHIAGAEKLLWNMFEGSLKVAANPDKRTEIKVTDEEFVKMVQDRSMKAQAPETLQPKNTGYTSLANSISNFKKTRMEHIKYMKTSTEDLRNHIVQMPNGWIDCYQLYLMIAAHSNRHLQQIEEIKASPGFPNK